MNTENYREDYTFHAWASGNKRSKHDRAKLTLKPKDTNGEIGLCYTRAWGWIVAYSTESKLLERISSPADLENFCNLLFKYLVKDDIYGTKIKWEADGTLKDVSIY